MGAGRRRTLWHLRVLLIAAELGGVHLWPHGRLKADVGIVVRAAGAHFALGRRRHGGGGRGRRLVARLEGAGREAAGLQSGPRMGLQGPSTAGRGA